MDRRSPGTVPLSGRLRAFVLLLVGILLVYAAIIVIDDFTVSGAPKVAVLGALLVGAAWTRRHSSARLAAFGVVSAVLVLVVLAVSVAGPVRLAFGVSGAAMVLLSVGTVAMLIATLAAVRRVDFSTVLGVLCVYLLIALIFAALGQVGAAFQYGQDQFVRGVVGPPSPSDLLYFSVITLCTVGYGDIAPVSAVARALAVIEALVGQLYLVSIVAAVIAGWQVGGTARAERKDR
ncbi:potassium channel family protein [Luedemannella helvata]|uniref:Potassium channel domain-containing protein n=1 Tax=Luedemannella helvata TaxID=349315 RepID=A0ABP4VT58_9ACTN